MNWIQKPVLLEGQKVKLAPLGSEHFPSLLEIGKQKIIWENFTIDGSDEEQLISNLQSGMLMRASGEQYPFAIIDKKTGKTIGSTRFLNIFSEHRKLEIGSTWYDPAYWGTGYNTECKYLLLEHCFETLKTARVQLQTSEKNLRSRAAIQKIGATFEGMLRKERILPNGNFRNTAVFSIIDDEWPQVKQMLQKRLSE